MPVRTCCAILMGTQRSSSTVYALCNLSSEPVECEMHFVVQQWTRKAASGFMCLDRIHHRQFHMSSSALYYIEGALTR